MRRFRAIIIAIAALASHACTDSSSTPVMPSDSAPILIGSSIDAPAKVVVFGTPPAVGASSQFTATAVQADGSSAIVTSLAGWRSSNTAVATVSSSGVVSGVQAGQVEIAATYAAVTGSLTSTVAPTRTSGCPTLGFDDQQPNGAAFTAYRACGFTVTPTTPNWTIITTYGHPAPFIEFLSRGGSTTTGEVSVSAGGTKFRFQSVDLYSSTTPIPYVITGISNGAVVFTLQNTQGNTFGNFATIVNPQASTFIDMLLIRLSNAAAPCCQNPMGLDTIAVSF